MPKTHQPMRLSCEEEQFLRRWMHDEVHYQEGQGPAKRLQLLHRAIPADLATLIAAAIPDPADQQAAGLAIPSAEPLVWPRSEERFRARVAEAQAVLADRTAETRGQAF
jgi:hypothetical protein